MTGGGKVGCVELEVTIPKSDIEGLKIFYKEDFKYVIIYFTLFAFGFLTTLVGVLL